MAYKVLSSHEPKSIKHKTEILSHEAEIARTLNKKFANITILTDVIPYLQLALLTCFFCTPLLHALYCTGSHTYRNRVVALKNPALEYKYELRSAALRGQYPLMNGPWSTNLLNSMP